LLTEITEKEASNRAASSMNELAEPNASSESSGNFHHAEVCQREKSQIL
jgi:hypothetical protein